MFSWSRTFEGETPLDLVDFNLSLSKKEGFAKTIQFLKKKKNDMNEKQIF
jgi:hypothetical protein